MVGTRCGHHSGMTAEGKIDTMEDEPEGSEGAVPPPFEDFCDAAAPLLREALRKNPRLLEDATVAVAQWARARTQAGAGGAATSAASASAAPASGSGLVPGRT